MTSNSRRDSTLYDTILQVASIHRFADFTYVKSAMANITMAEARGKSTSTDLHFDSQSSVQFARQPEVDELAGGLGAQLVPTIDA